MKAMILAAGLGTRLKPFTDKHPKALALVNGKTLLQRNIEYLAGFGIKDVIVNVHHFAEQIISALKENNGFGSRVSISDESDEVLETGGGLKKAGYFFVDNEPFVLMNADILTDMDIRDLIRFHSDSNAFATLAVTQRQSSRNLLFDKTGRLSGWRNSVSGEEKISRRADEYFPAAFSGIHMIHPAIFDKMTEAGRFSIIDLYLRLAAEEIIMAYDAKDSIVMDVGRPESLLKAAEIFTD